MEIRYLNQLDPTMECIKILERRFDPMVDMYHSIEEMKPYLSETYSVPVFELEPLLQPLSELERYVNAGLSASEERLRFFFSPRSSGPVSLATHLYPLLKAGVRLGDMPEAERMQRLAYPVSQIVEVETETLEDLRTEEALARFLLASSCSEDVKWLCISLYYALDSYLDELEAILRQAVGLFLSRLPDVTGLCDRTLDYVRESIGDNPAQLFEHFDAPVPTSDVTVQPSLMDFHRVHWNFPQSIIYMGVYREAISQLIKKYADQSANLVSCLKAMGDKNRLEVLRILRKGESNGQEIAEELGLAPATISHHMNLLCVEELVSATKRGTSVYYALNRPALRRRLEGLSRYLL